VWLLRLIPPARAASTFRRPGYCSKSRPKKKAPARTPWWATLMRLSACRLLVIIAAPVRYGIRVTTGRRARRLRS